MTSPYLEPVLDWYSVNARDLPWRAPAATSWSVLVSEVMLQQTPVSRVLPAHRAWLARWPSPAALAADPPAAAVRQWGRLGYPRRALRLHETASIVTRQHDGKIPSSRDELLTLPGIGAYTAAAVAVFAFGRRHAVLDTNVRRVLARLTSGREFPGPQPSAAEYRLAESLLPADAAVAARWSVAVMELGALTCTAARPRCGECPIAAQCAWLAAGRPAAKAKRAGQRYEGTDRQCRGRLLALLRDSPEPVEITRFDLAWPDNEQRSRALDGLVADGLVDPLPDGTFALPALRPAHTRKRGRLWCHGACFGAALGHRLTRRDTTRPRDTMPHTPSRAPEPSPALRLKQGRWRCRRRWPARSPRRRRPSPRRGPTPASARRRR
jgi:A/G-specific adenine glycosylase